MTWGRAKPGRLGHFSTTDPLGCPHDGAPDSAQRKSDRNHGAEAGPEGQNSAIRARDSLRICADRPGTESYAASIFRIDPVIGTGTGIAWPSAR